MLWVIKIDMDDSKNIFSVKTEEYYYISWKINIETQMVTKYFKILIDLCLQKC